MMRLTVGVALAVVLGLLACVGLSCFAKAGDMGDAAHDWSGMYAGVAINGLGGGINFKGIGGDTDVEDSAISVSGLVGYNFSSGPFVYGLEADFGTTGLDERDTVAGLGTVHAESDWTAAMALRAGWAFDDLLLYAKAGVAFTDLELSSTAGGSTSSTLTGGMLGIGAEYAVNERWSVRGELASSGFCDKATLAGTERKFEFGEAVARLGVTVKF
jgi:outer membrane immunogenic protein